jgi:hypothetical protein
MGIRLVLIRRGLRSSDFGIALEATLFPALVFAFGSDALARALGQPPAAWWLSGALCLATLVLFGWLSLSRNRLGRLSHVRWLPVVGAVALALFSSFRAQSVPTAASATPPGGSLPSQTSPPHIFLIILDTVRADHLKMYGYERDTMPRLEQWAEGALVAKRAVSPAGWTSPAHASLLSGRPVSLHGVHYGLKSFHTPAFDDVPWLPELLRREGYTSSAVLANPLALSRKVSGFSTVISPVRSPWRRSSVAALIDHYSPLFQRISERLRWRMPYANAAEIVRFVRSAAPPPESPAFVFINFLDAHSPYNPPEDALRSLGLEPAHIFSRYRSDRELDRLWPKLGVDGSDVLIDLYDGELRGMDVHLDRLLRWIEERYPESIIAITSDHGEELGEDGRVGHGYGLSQALVHVPLLLKGSGISAGPLEEPVTTRKLFGFLYHRALGRTGDALDFLTRPDEYGLVSERYPSGDGRRRGAEDSRRPWVAMFENGRKAIGPSEHGFEVWDVDRLGFDRPLRVERTTSHKLRSRIDLYWSANRDRREEAPLAAEPFSRTEELRALGYVE